MSSLGDSASMFAGGDPRASQFATMRHHQRVFSDPAIAHHQQASIASLSRDADQACHSVPVSPRKSASIARITQQTNNRYSAMQLGKFW